MVELTELIKLFRFWLEEAVPPRRKLKNISHLFKTAQNASTTTTSRILLNTSREAWAAYTIINPNKGGNFAGKKDCQHLFDLLDRASPEAKTDFAKAVAEIRPCPAMAEYIQTMLVTAEPSSCEMPGEPSCQDAAGTAAETPQQPTGPLLGDLFSGCLSDDGKASRKRKRPGPPSDVFRGAPTDALREVFPEYFSSVVERLGSGDKTTAAISITFPGGFEDVDCLMSISIKSDKVELLAYRLFNAVLETNDRGERELVIPGGLRVVPRTVTGAHRENYYEVLGSHMGNALDTAPNRRREIYESGNREATKSITMVECVEAQKAALLHLLLSRMHAAQISEKLFNTKPCSCYAVDRSAMMPLRKTKSRRLSFLPKLCHQKTRVHSSKEEIPSCSFPMARPLSTYSRSSPAAGHPSLPSSQSGPCPLSTFWFCRSFRCSASPLDSRRRSPSS